MAAQRLGKRVLSKLQSPSRARGPGGSPSGLQKRHARVTVKYDRRELQRRLDVEKWIDGCLEELYRGRESDMPDEVNIDELLELDSEEERCRKIQGLLEACANPTELLDARGTNVTACQSAWSWLRPGLWGLSLSLRNISLFHLSLCLSRIRVFVSLHLYFLFDFILSG
ncbi:protein phosphatase 1 regulatory subunit 14A isoform 3 [Mus musculus]|uniref:Protein phosphatase 1 regulatory subunit 14 n=1 Tax=Mus musculus TaxID=10090 RepID=A0A140LI58_MOUSE|nr:protein phosphatase 1 regulatory subunit 14A isoform 3 [Mus musculus]